MNNTISWTVGIGRWHGVHVRVHLLLVAFAASLLWWGAAGEPGSMLYGVLCVLALAVSVAAREVARLVVARRFGSDADQIALWPMGGWLAARPVRGRRGELAVALAPPLVGITLMALGAVVSMIIVSLMLGFGASLIHAGKIISWLPPSPTMLEGGGAVENAAAPFATAAALLAWTNGALLVINLLPVGSLDAGHVARALVRCDDPRRAARIMGRINVATAMAIGILGWAVWTVQPAASLALWLVAGGMVRRERDEPTRTERRRVCVPRLIDRPLASRGCHYNVALSHCCRVDHGCHELAVAHCHDVPQHQPVAGETSGAAQGAGAQRSGWLGLMSAARTRLLRAARRRRLF